MPEERKTEGVFLGLKTSANVSLSLLGHLSRFGVLNRALEAQRVSAEAQRVDLAARYLGLKIGELSGGNQQKALIARVLASGARNLGLYDPTRGVDVGTKAVIYEVIRAFAREGGAALIYSTELSELIFRRRLLQRTGVAEGKEPVRLHALRHFASIPLIHLGLRLTQELTINMSQSCPFLENERNQDCR